MEGRHGVGVSIFDWLLTPGFDSWLHPIKFFVIVLSLDMK